MAGPAIPAAEADLPDRPAQAVPTNAFDWLRRARPHLSERLVSRGAWEKACTLSRHLPADGLYALEIRLSPPPSLVDLSIRPAPSDALNQLLRKLAPPSLRTFLEDWKQKDTWAPLSAVWLEFDLPPGILLDPPLRPSVCAQLRQPTDPRFLLATLFPALHGRPLSRAQESSALHILESLPPEARLLYAFSMLPRAQDAVRLEAIGVPGDTVVETVERAGAKETAGQAAEAAALLGEVDRPHLSFDLLPNGVSPRVGLEGSFRRLPHREPRWAALFDRLEAAGLCCPEKRRAIFAWPGHEAARGLSHRADFLVRSLSHVKLVCQPRQPLEAKVYLLLEHLPRNSTQT